MVRASSSIRKGLTLPVRTAGPTVNSHRVQNLDAISKIEKWFEIKDGAGS
jgi:hypothetical protein